ncbi:glycosyltransferase [Fulvitalea axinellae]
MWIFAGVLFSLTCFYAVGLLVVRKKWLAVGDSQKTSSDGLKISVLVAARNEEKSLGRLLEALGGQQFQPEEIIVVNDHSDDATRSVLEAWSDRLPNLRILDNIGQGKKSAVAYGVTQATGDVIAVTDADCWMESVWLAGLAGGFSDEKVKMVCAPVYIQPDGGFLSKAQTWEMAALGMVAGVAIKSGSPLFCNAANMAFRKDVFLEVGGYEGNAHIPSGDDEFLLRKIKESYPGGVEYVAGANVLVRTGAQENLKKFLSQRRRWAGKWNASGFGLTAVVALSVLAFHLMNLSAYAFSFSGFLPWWLLVSQQAVKLVSEYVFLQVFFFNKEDVPGFPSFMLTGILYPLYAVVVGFTANRGGYEWKGRKYEAPNEKARPVKG